jgi:hypothetical protein
VPFLGIGDAVEGPHPVLEEHAKADRLIETVEALLARR